MMGDDDLLRRESDGAQLNRTIGSSTRICSIIVENVEKHRQKQEDETASAPLHSRESTGSWM
jgi:hypothetical protein